MRLRYKAATKDGKLSQGLLDARDVGEAANYLRSKELLPIQITNVDNQLLTRIPFLNNRYNFVYQAAFVNAFVRSYINALFGNIKRTTAKPENDRSCNLYNK